MVTFRSVLMLILMPGMGCLLDAQVTLNIGSGLSVATGNISRQTQVGFNVSAGAGFNFSRRFATSLEFDSNTIDVNAAQNLGFYSVQIWSFTADPRIKFDITEGLQIYVTGGGGLYSRKDPVNGATYKSGVNAGGGLGLRLSETVTLYFETRYHRMFTTGPDTTYEPIVIGVRWH